MKITSSLVLAEKLNSRLEVVIELIKFGVITVSVSVSVWLYHKDWPKLESKEHRTEPLFLLADSASIHVGLVSRDRTMTSRRRGGGTGTIGKSGREYAPGVSGMSEGTPLQLCDRPHPSDCVEPGIVYAYPLPGTR